MGNSSDALLLINGIRTIEWLTSVRAYCSATHSAVVSSEVNFNAIPAVDSLRFELTEILSLKNPITSSVAVLRVPRSPMVYGRQHDHADTRNYHSNPQTPSLTAENNHYNVNVSQTDGELKVLNTRQKKKDYGLNNKDPTSSYLDLDAISGAGEALRSLQIDVRAIFRPRPRRPDRSPPSEIVTSKKNTSIRILHTRQHSRVTHQLKCGPTRSRPGFPRPSAAR
jgi:hypothetical protein